MAESESLEPSEESKEIFTPAQELKINLFTHGIRPTQQARAAIQGIEGRPLDTGDYVSTDGVILKVGDIIINAPYPDSNPFARNTPYSLEYSDNKLWVVNRDQQTAVEHIPIPAYINQHNHSGIRYGDMTITHTDRARVSPIKGCALDCQFCNIPWEFKYNKWDIEDLVESVGIALNDPIRPAQHLLISGGTPGPRDFQYLQNVWDAMTKAYRGLDIDVMMTPSRSRDGRELMDPKWLKDIGINALSVNIELSDDDELARELMRGKNNIGRQAYYDFLEQAVQIFGVGKVRSILMLGLEPVEKTLKTVEELAKRGISPELSPFRPDPATPLKDHLPPSVEDQKQAYWGTQRILSKYKLQFPSLNDGLQCMECMHNVLMFPGKDSYHPHYDQEKKVTSYEFPLG